MASEKCRVLLIDDNYQFRRRIRLKYLSLCEVTELPSGAKLAEILQSMHVDCILMDYQLPGASGEELVRLARQMEYHGAIVAISSSEYFNNLLLRAGADTAVIKREAHFLPQMIRQGLSLAEARWGTARCEFESP
ncbi:MAG: response regulator [Calditrichota bacterium]